MRRLPTLLIALAVTALLAGCGGGGGSSSTTAKKPAAVATTPAPTASVGGCKQVKPATPAKHDVPKPTKQDALPADATAVVTLATSCGPITITLDQQAQPKTASNFAYLVKKGFYDGLTFHRVVPNFVIQGGDPQGDGQGGPGYAVREQPPADAQYTRGVVAMAKTQNEPAGTSGSQFFIVTTPDAGLPPDYAIAGKVTGGDQAVEQIAQVQTNPADEQPVQPVVIMKATLKVSQ